MQFCRNYKVVTQPGKKEGREIVHNSGRRMKERETELKGPRGSVWYTKGEFSVPCEQLRH